MAWRHGLQRVARRVAVEWSRIAFAASQVGPAAELPMPRYAQPGERILSRQATQSNQILRRKLECHRPDTTGFWPVISEAH